MQGANGISSASQGAQIALYTFIAIMAVFVLALIVMCCMGCVRAWKSGSPAKEGKRRDPVPRESSPPLGPMDRERWLFQNDSWGNDPEESESSTEGSSAPAVSVSEASLSQSAKNSEESESSTEGSSAPAVSVSGVSLSQSTKNSDVFGLD